MLMPLTLVAAAPGGAGDAASPAGVSGDLSIVFSWTGSEQEAFDAVLDDFEADRKSVV